MFIYRPPRQGYQKVRIYKLSISDEGKKALERIQEMLKKHEKEIRLALVAMWLTSGDDIDEDEITAAMRDETKIDDMADKYRSSVSDFADTVLTPELENVGYERFETATNDFEDIIDVPEGVNIPLLHTGPQTGTDSPLLLPAGTEPFLLPEGNELQTNQFDYTVFYEQWCDTRAGNLIADMTDTQRENIKYIINEALNSGETPSATMHRIRDTIGLTNRQLIQNQRYYQAVYNELREKNPKKSDEEIRERALEAARKAADKKRTERAKNITRSELNAAHNQAARAYIQWAIEHGYMKDVYREWVTSGNDNVCPVCFALNHQRIPFNQDYVIPDGVPYHEGTIKMPPGHPSCCCSEIYSTGGTASAGNADVWNNMSDTEKKKHINYHSDKEQYKNYKKRLGKENVPKNLEKFQDLKYNGTEEWINLQQQYKDANPKSVRTGYSYTKDGTLIATNHRKSGSVPKTLKPYAVLDMTMGDGHIERSIYNKDSNLSKQIHPTDHGNTKQHPYGEYGEHAHTFTWKDGELVGRNTRELTERERKVNGDIL